MPRPRTGTVVWVPPKKGETQGHYKYRLTINDEHGSTRREWFHLPASPRSPQAEFAAKERARAAVEKIAREGIVSVPHAARRSAGTPVEGETVEDWCDRWLADREKRGLTSVDDDRGRIKKWVKPILGTGTPMAAITRTDIERLVEHLDTSVQADLLKWKTAQNVWGLVSKMFDDATNAKTLSLRVLEDNPAVGVRAPDRGAKVSKVYLYPSEFAMLVACTEVPLRWRRLFAITTYLYLRAAEVRGLEWDDFDLEHRVVHLHRAVDDDGTVTSLKGDDARRVQIEPTLVPLLATMHEDADGKGRVFPPRPGTCVPNEEDLADGLRKWLKRAGVDRAELYKTTKTQRRLRFHDLRATGITWRAVRGDEPLKIMRAAGHKDFGTTMEYVRDAEQVNEQFGTVFPALPESMIGTEETRGIVPGIVSMPANYSKAWRSQRELNPRYRRERPVS